MNKLRNLASQMKKFSKWQEIADKMYLPEDKELGIFVQHDGFLDKDITLDENNNPINKIPADELPINQHWSMG